MTVATSLLTLFSLAVGAAPPGHADFSIGVGATGYALVFPRPVAPVMTAGAGPTLSLRANVGMLAVDVRGSLGCGALAVYPSTILLPPSAAVDGGGAQQSASLLGALRVPAGDDADLLLSLGAYAALGADPSGDVFPWNSNPLGVQGGPAWSTWLWDLPIELRADVQLALLPSIRPALLLTAETRFDLCCTPRTPTPAAR